MGEETVNPFGISCPVSGSERSLPGPSGIFLGCVFLSLDLAPLSGEDYTRKFVCFLPARVQFIAFSTQDSCFSGAISCNKYTFPPVRCSGEGTTVFPPSHILRIPTTLCPKSSFDPGSPYPDPQIPTFVVVPQSHTLPLCQTQTSVTCLSFPFWFTQGFRLGGWCYYAPSTSPRVCFCTQLSARCLLVFPSPWRVSHVMT